MPASPPISTRQPWPPSADARSAPSRCCCRSRPTRPDGGRGRAAGGVEGDATMAPPFWLVCDTDHTAPAADRQAELRPQPPDPLPPERRGEGGARSARKPDRFKRIRYYSAEGK